MKKLILFSLLCLSAVAYMRAEVYTVETLPNPKNTCAACWVCNPDGILLDDVEAYFNESSEMIKELSTAEIAVVVINAFDEDKYGDAFSFCQTLFNTWGIGDKENNSGVLLFFALQSRDIRIHTGGGLEGMLPDIVCDNIIDLGFDNLRAGNYNEGLMDIYDGIRDVLITPEARAELALGFKPKTTEDANVFEGYCYAAIIIFVLLYLLAYKRWNDPKAVTRQKKMDNTESPQTAIGCLSFLFPLPVLFLWLYYRKRRDNIRTEPEVCPKCKAKMTRLSGADQSIYLTPVQQTEERIQSNDYDVWLCPSCGETHLEAFNGKMRTKYTECPVCHAKANKFVGSQVLVRATTKTKGKKEVTYRCEHCGN